VDVEGATHKQVVDLIRSGGDKLSLSGNYLLIPHALLSLCLAYIVTVFVVLVICFLIFILFVCLWNFCVCVCVCAFFPLSLELLTQYS